MREHARRQAVERLVVERRGLFPIRDAVDEQDRAGRLLVEERRAVLPVHLEDGRRALDLALRTLQEIEQHTVRIGANSLLQSAK